MPRTTAYVRWEGSEDSLPGCRARRRHRLLLLEDACEKAPDSNQFLDLIQLQIATIGDNVRGFKLKEFVAFFWGSAVGLAIDLVGFQILVWVGLLPWQANAISSTLSITAVYLLVTRFSFESRSKLSTYFIFLIWYGCSILFFSVVIQLGVSLLDWHPLTCKLLSVPVSFLLNYFFSRFLFRRGESGGAKILPV